MGESWKITAKIFLREFEVGDIEQKIKYLFCKSWEGGGGEWKKYCKHYFNRRYKYTSLNSKTLVLEVLRYEPICNKVYAIKWSKTKDQSKGSVSVILQCAIHNRRTFNCFVWFMKQLWMFKIWKSDFFYFAFIANVISAILLQEHI